MDPVPRMLTLEEAQSLGARLAAIVLEHTRLQEEVRQMRLILSELASLSVLLHNDDAPARAVYPSLSANGHIATPLPHREVYPSESETRGEAGGWEAPPASYDTSPQCQINPGTELSGEPQSNQAADPPHGLSLKGTGAGDDMSRVTDEPYPEQAVSPIAETGETSAQPQTKAETPASLPASLTRVLEALERSPRPQRPWQIDKALGISRLPSSELSKLVQMGMVVRIRPGIYGLANRVYRDYV